MNYIKWSSFDENKIVDLKTAKKKNVYDIESTDETKITIQELYYNYSPNFCGLLTIQTPYFKLQGCNIYNEYIIVNNINENFKVMLDIFKRIDVYLKLIIGDTYEMPI